MNDLAVIDVKTGEVLDGGDQIQMGRDAWIRIKDTGKKLLDDWLVLAGALDIGRQLYTTDSGGLNKKGFGQWCASHGFDDIPRQERAASLWVLDEWDSNDILYDIRNDTSINNPVGLYNECISREGVDEQSNVLVSKFTGDEEWYTPEQYIVSARKVMGGIDLDPASNDHANELINATEYFTIDDDGLQKEWLGRVWLNPPYTARVINTFIEKTVEGFVSGGITDAIVLTNSNTDTSWFHLAANNCTAICFTDGRISFYKEDGERSSPTNGQCFFYFGEDIDLFIAEFSTHGLVMEVSNGAS